MQFAMVETADAFFDFRAAAAASGRRVHGLARGVGFQRALSPRPRAAPSPVRRPWPGLPPRLWFLLPRRRARRISAPPSRALRASALVFTSAVALAFAAAAALAFASASAALAANSPTYSILAFSFNCFMLIGDQRRGRALIEQIGLYARRRVRFIYRRRLARREAPSTSLRLPDAFQHADLAVLHRLDRRHVFDRQLFGETHAAARLERRCPGI